MKEEKKPVKLRVPPTVTIIKVREMNWERSSAKATPAAKAPKSNNCFIQLLELLDDYCDHSSMHGLQYVGDEERHFTERIFWLVSFFLGMSCGLYLISDVWWKYTQNPVFVSFDASSNPIWDVPFPAVTICNLNKIRNSSFQRGNPQNTEAEETMYRTICNLNNRSSKTSSNTKAKRFEKDYVQFLEQVSFPCSSMIPACEWKGSEDCSNKIKSIVTDEGLCCSFNIIPQEILYKTRMVANPSTTVDWVPDFGYPSTVGLNATPMRALGAGVRYGLTITLDVSRWDYITECSHGVIGFKLLLHSPVEMPMVSDIGFLVAPDTQNVITVKPNIMWATQRIKSVKPKKRLCYFEDERRLYFYSFYTQRNCQMECEANFTASACGCVLFHMPKNKTTPICENENLRCVDQAIALMRMRTFENDMNEDEEARSDPHKLELADCGCMPACSEVNYDHDLSSCSLTESYFDNMGWSLNGSYIRKNLAVIQVFFKDLQFVSTTRDEMFGFTDFLANTGGLLSLFLGFSMLSAVEVVYYFTFRYYCTKRTKKREIASSQKNRPVQALF